MFSLILKLVLFFAVLQGIRALFRRGGSRGTSRFSPKTDPDRGKKPDYTDLTPYEIEDADYEDLPKEKN